MRWIWIDRIVELVPRERLVTVKNVSAGEDVLHDHFPATGDRPAMPVMPNPLIIEGMAQTAGILVGHAGKFQHNVILAKIARASFTAAARPGFTIRHTATLTNFSKVGGTTEGVTELIDPHDGSVRPLARIDLMFSHADAARGLDLPDENFVFTSQFMNLLKDVPR